jgi:hypothetical protein
MPMQMGQCFKIVNPVKRQYLDPGRFDENQKASGFLVGLHAAAVAVLVCKPLDVPEQYRYGPLAGAWFGDALYAAGDDYGQANPDGITTVTPENPRRNLNEMAKQEFEDVSYQAIAMLCQGREYYADQLARAAAEPLGSYLLVHLGNIVFEQGCDALRDALVRALGSDWTKQYKQACEMRP